MHKMQLGGWPYPKGQWSSSKASSLRASVLLAIVFRSRIVAVIAMHGMPSSEAC